jgi:hypothetical protein
MKQQWEINQKENESHEFGLSIIPVSSKKQPFSPWAEYQTKIAPTSEWYSHYCNQGTVGIITGKVSGNLEVIDIDVKNDPEGTIMEELVNLIPSSLYSRLLVQTTPNKGYHVIYRCQDVVIEKNQKLALHLDQAVIIETRGEGGYFCTSKIKNKFIQGKLNLEAMDYEITVITGDEREFLLETARSLTRYFPIRIMNSSKNENGFNYKEPAINEFNNKYLSIDIFTKHGWTVENEDELRYYLLRPGSSARHSGYYFKDSRTFFCFSTSTGFQPEKPYNNFQILQVLEGDNDYKKTLRLLPEYGYSVSQKKDKITHDDIASFLNEAGVRYDSFLQDITLNGSIIEEIDYNTLYINLKKHFDREIPRSRFEEIIKSRYIIEVNPVMDYIKRNEHRDPHGTFEKWLDCMTLKNKSIEKNLVLYYLKKWYVGLVAQPMNPKFPNEYFLCLISSDQGIGKTTFLREYTLPKELQKYCAQHALNIDDDFKVIMGQSILVIDDEMDGRTYETEKTFKNMMSQNELTTRRKYDRRISKIKRRCSFAGSGNNLNVIREHQNRRIIPIEVEQFDFDKMEQIDLDDLFMEAYYLYQSGFRYSYTVDDKDWLSLLSEDYVQKSDADLILDSYVLSPESASDVYQISLLDIVTILPDQYPYFFKRLNAVTVGKLLNDRGFKSIRKGRNKTTYYEISRQSDIIKLVSDDSDGKIYLG